MRHLSQRFLEYEENRRTAADGVESRTRSVVRKNEVLSTVLLEKLSECRCGLSVCHLQRPEEEAAEDRHTRDRMQIK